jgi:hypothetical protein
VAFILVKSVDAVAEDIADDVVRHFDGGLDRSVRYN